MNINSIPTNNINKVTLRPSASNFKKGTASLQATAPSFRDVSLNLGNVSPRFQSHNVNPRVEKLENWCISNYFLVTREEVGPALTAVRKKIDNTDFSGMTNIEIYDWIENIFAETFGKDFMMAFNLYIPDPISSDVSNETAMETMVMGQHNDGTLRMSKNFIAIGVSFQNAVFSQVGFSPITEINRQRLFGDMSNAEIMETIRSRYPENDKLTNRHVQLMFAELRAVGISCPMFGINKCEFSIKRDANGNQLNFPSNYEVLNNWVKFVNQPFEPSLMFGSFNNMWRHRHERHDLSDLVEIKNFLVNHLGATIGPDGMLQPDFFAQFGHGFEWDVEYNLENLIPDLEEEFIKALDEHDESLREKEEQLNRGYLYGNMLNSNIQLESKVTGNDVK